MDYIESILRERTAESFTDNWYRTVSREIRNSKNYDKKDNDIDAWVHRLKPIFRELPCNEKIDKSILFDKVSKEHKGLSQKKTTEILKRYLINYSIDFNEGKSGGLRYIIINN